MTRLIDADELKKATINNFDNLQAYFPKDFIEEIDNAPTVEPEEVTKLKRENAALEQEMLYCRENWKKAERPQGEWITDNLHNTICNKCGGIRRDNRVEYIAFCNKCGAKMKGVNNA